MAKFTEREAGVYRCRFVSLNEDFRITDRQTQQEVVRWRWVFQEVADPTTVGELDTITSPGFKRNSNGLKFLSGMLGRPPTQQDDTDQLIGQEFDVRYGPNQAGTLAIIGVTRPTKAPTTGLPAQEFAAQNAGELPF